MVYSSEFSRPTYYSGTNRSRSSSLSRYSSPVRSSHVSSSRASTPLASYRTPALRTLLQETSDSPYSSRRSSISSSSDSSRRSSFSREFQRETTEHPYSGRRDSLSSLGSSRRSSFSREPETNDSFLKRHRDSLNSLSSSRRSSFSRNSPAPTQKQVHFQEDEKETDATTSLMNNGAKINCDRIQKINRKIDYISPMPSFDDNSYAMGKLSVRERYPTASCDASRQRQARAAYWSALDDTGIFIKNRDTI